MAKPECTGGSKSLKVQFGTQERGLDKIGFGSRVQRGLLGRESGTLRANKAETPVKFGERMAVRMHNRAPSSAGGESGPS